MNYEIRIASLNDLEAIWDKNVNENAGDSSWIHWKSEYIGYNIQNMAYTFCIVLDGQPIGEGTLLVSEECSAISNRKNLANNSVIGNGIFEIIQKVYRVLKKEGRLCIGAPYLKIG